MKARVLKARVGVPMAPADVDLVTDDEKVENVGLVGDAADLIVDLLEAVEAQEARIAKLEALLDVED